MARLIRKKLGGHYDTFVTAFTKMEEFQLYQLFMFISDLRYQNDRKVLALRETKANCLFIRHSWSRFPLKQNFRIYPISEITLIHLTKRSIGIYACIYTAVNSEGSLHI